MNPKASLPKYQLGQHPTNPGLGQVWFCGDVKVVANTLHGQEFTVSELIDFRDQIDGLISACQSSEQEWIDEPVTPEDHFRELEQAS